MRLAVIITMILFSAQLMFAQTRVVSGVVKDFQSGNPYPNLKLDVKNTSLTTTTGDDGRYTLQVPMDITKIEFSEISGMIIKNVDYVSDNEINLLIVPVENTQVYDLSLAEMMQVEIVTAGRKAEKVSEIPASVVLITKQEIEKYGFTSLEEIFQNIPGLYYADQKSFLGPTIGVRGYMTANPSNLIVMLNGVPQMNDLYNTFAFSHTPIAVEAIDRIEVVRGPMSVIYGSNAFFGAINIITNENTESETMHTNVSAGIGNLDSYKAQISGKGSSGDISYAFSGSFNKTGSMDVPFADLITGFDTKYAALGFLSADATTKDYFPNEQKYFMFSGKFKEFTFDMSFASTMFGHTILQAFYKPGMMKSRYGKGSVGYSHEFSDKFSINAKANYNRYDLYLQDNFFSIDPNGFDYDSDIYSYGEYWSEKVDFEFNFFYNPTEKLKLTGGASAAMILDAGDKTDAPYSSYPNPVGNLLNRSGGLVPGQYANLYSAYAQAEFKATEWLNFVVGARTEHMSKFDMVFYRGMYTTAHQKYEFTYDNPDYLLVPRFAAIVKANENHVFKLMYGEAHKLPDIWQLRGNMPNKPLITLEPEKIKTAELNYNGVLSESIGASFSVFYNDFSNLILRTIITEPSYSSYFTNSGKMKTIGTEVTVNAKMGENFRADVSLTYQKTENESEGMKDIDVEFSPNVLGYIKLSYQLPKNINIGISGNYVDEMLAQYDKAQDPTKPVYTPIGYYGAKVPSYFLLNANIRIDNIGGWADGTNGLYMNLKFNNILDQEIRYAATSLSKWADKGTIGLPRMFMVSLGYKF